MEEVLVTLFIVVVFAFLVFLAIKVAKKDILMTRIATVLCVLWLFYFNVIERSINYFSLEKFVTMCLFPLVLFWGFAWIANAWIEKRGSNE
jgi:hypothetical protein